MQNFYLAVTTETFSKNDSTNQINDKPPTETETTTTLITNEYDENKEYLQKLEFELETKDESEPTHYEYYEQDDEDKMNLTFDEEDDYDLNENETETEEEKNKKLNLNDQREKLEMDFSHSAQAMDSIEKQSPILERELLTTGQELENFRSRLAMSETVSAVTKSVIDEIRKEYNFTETVEEKEDDEALAEENQTTLNSEIEIHELEEEVEEPKLVVKNEHEPKIAENVEEVKFEEEKVEEPQINEEKKQEQKSEKQITVEEKEELEDFRNSSSNDECAAYKSNEVTNSSSNENEPLVESDHRHMDLNEVITDANIELAELNEKFKQMEESLKSKLESKLIDQVIQNFATESKSQIEKIMMIHELDDHDENEGDDESDKILKSTTGQVAYSSESTSATEMDEKLIGSEETRVESLLDAQQQQHVRKLSISQTQLIESEECDYSESETNKQNNSLLDNTNENDDDVVNNKSDIFSKSKLYQTFESSSSTDSNLNRHDFERKRSSTRKAESIDKSKKDDDEDDDNNNDGGMAEAVRKASFANARSDSSEPLIENQQEGVTKKEADVVDVPNVISCSSGDEELAQETTKSGSNLLDVSKIAGISESREYLLENEEKLEVEPIFVEDPSSGGQSLLIPAQHTPIDERGSIDDVSITTVIERRFSNALRNESASNQALIDEKTPTTEQHTAQPMSSFEISSEGEEHPTAGPNKTRRKTKEDIIETVIGLESANLIESSSNSSLASNSGEQGKQSVLTNVVTVTASKSEPESPNQVSSLNEKKSTMFLQLKRNSINGSESTEPLVQPQNAMETVNLLTEDDEEEISLEELKCRPYETVVGSGDQSGFRNSSSSNFSCTTSEENLLSRNVVETKSEIGSVSSVNDDQIRLNETNGHVFSRSLNNLSSLVVADNKKEPKKKSDNQNKNADSIDSVSRLIEEESQRMSNEKEAQFEQEQKVKASSIKISHSLDLNNRSTVARPLTLVSKSNEFNYLHSLDIDLADVADSTNNNMPSSLSFLKEYQLQQKRQMSEQLEQEQQTPTPVENLPGNFFDKRVTSSNEPSIDERSFSNSFSNNMNDFVDTRLSRDVSERSFVDPDPSRDLDTYDPATMMMDTDEYRENLVIDQVCADLEESEISAAVATALLFSSTLSTQSSDEIKSQTKSIEIESDEYSREAVNDEVYQYEMASAGIANPAFKDDTDEVSEAVEFTVKNENLSQSSSNSMLVDRDYDDTEDQNIMKMKIEESLKLDREENNFEGMCSLDAEYRKAESQFEEKVNTPELRTKDGILLDDHAFLVWTPTSSNQTPQSEKENDNVANIGQDESKALAMQIVENVATRAVEIEKALHEEYGLEKGTTLDETFSILNDDEVEINPRSLLSQESIEKIDLAQKIVSKVTNAALEIYSVEDNEQSSIVNDAKVQESVKDLSYNYAEVKLSSNDEIKFENEVLEDITDEKVEESHALESETQDSQESFEKVELAEQIVKHVASQAFDILTCDTEETKEETVSPNVTLIDDNIQKEVSSELVNTLALNEIELAQKIVKDVASKALEVVSNIDETSSIDSVDKSEPVTPSKRKSISRRSLASQMLQYFANNPEPDVVASNKDIEPEVTIVSTIVDFPVQTEHVETIETIYGSAESKSTMQTIEENVETTELASLIVKHVTFKALEVVSELKVKSDDVEVAQEGTSSVQSVETSSSNSKSTTPVKRKSIGRKRLAGQIMQYFANNPDPEPEVVPAAEELIIQPIETVIESTIEIKAAPLAKSTLEKQDSIETTKLASQIVQNVAAKALEIVSNVEESESVSTTPKKRVIGRKSLASQMLQYFANNPEQEPIEMAKKETETVAEPMPMTQTDELQIKQNEDKPETLEENVARSQLEKQESFDKSSLAQEIVKDVSSRALDILSSEKLAEEDAISLVEIEQDAFNDDAIAASTLEAINNDTSDYSEIRAIEMESYIFNVDTNVTKEGKLDIDISGDLIDKVKDFADSDLELKSTPEIMSDETSEDTVRHVSLYEIDRIAQNIENIPAESVLSKQSTGSDSNFEVLMESEPHVETLETKEEEPIEFDDEKNHEIAKNLVSEILTKSTELLASLIEDEASLNVQEKTSDAEEGESSDKNSKKKKNPKDDHEHGNLNTFKKRDDDDDDDESKDDFSKFDRDSGAVKQTQVSDDSTKTITTEAQTSNKEPQTTDKENEIVETDLPLEISEPITTEKENEIVDSEFPAKINEPKTTENILVETEVPVETNELVDLEVPVETNELVDLEVPVEINIPHTTEKEKELVETEVQVETNEPETTENENELILLENMVDINEQESASLDDEQQRINNNDFINKMTSDEDVLSNSVSFENKQTTELVMNSENVAPTPLLTSSFISTTGSLPHDEATQNDDFLSVTTNSASFLTAKTSDNKSDDDEDRLSNKTLFQDIPPNEDRCGYDTTLSDFEPKIEMLTRSSSTTVDSYFTAVTSLAHGSKHFDEDEIAKKALFTKRSYTISIISGGDESSSNYMTAVEGSHLHSQSHDNVSHSDSFYSAMDENSANNTNKDSSHDHDISSGGSEYSTGMSGKVSALTSLNSSCSALSGENSDSDITYECTDTEDPVNAESVSLGQFNVEYFLKGMQPLVHQTNSTLHVDKFDTLSHSTLTDDDNDETAKTKSGEDQKPSENTNDEQFVIISKEDFVSAKTEPDLVDEDYVITTRMDVTESNKIEESTLSIDNQSDDTLTKEGCPSLNESGSLVIEPEMAIISNKNLSEWISSEIHGKFTDENSASSSPKTGNESIYSSNGGDNASNTSSVLEFEKLEMQCSSDDLDMLNADKQKHRQRSNRENEEENVCYEERDEEGLDMENLAYDLISHDLNTIYESAEVSSNEEQPIDSKPQQLPESDSSDLKRGPKSDDLAINFLTGVNKPDLNLDGILKNEPFTASELDDFSSKKSDLLKMSLANRITEVAASTSAASASSSPLGSPLIKHTLRLVQTPDRENALKQMKSTFSSRSSSSSSVRSTDSFENELKCKFKVDESSFFAKKLKEKASPPIPPTFETKVVTSSEIKAKSNEDQTLKIPQSDSGQCSMTDSVMSSLQSPESNSNIRQSASDSFNDSFVSDVSISLGSGITGGTSSQLISSPSAANSNMVLIDSPNEPESSSSLSYSEEATSSKSGLSSYRSKKSTPPQQSAGRMSRTSSSASSCSSTSITDSTSANSSRYSASNSGVTKSVYSAEDLPSFRKVTSPVSSLLTVGNKATTLTKPVSGGSTSTSNTSNRDSSIPQSSSSSALLSSASSSNSSNSNTDSKLPRKIINSNPNLTAAHSHHSSNCYCGKQQPTDTPKTVNFNFTKRSDMFTAGTEPKSAEKKSSPQSDTGKRAKYKKIEK